MWFTLCLSSVSANGVQDDSTEKDIEGIFRTYHANEGRKLADEPALAGGNSVACTGGPVTYVMAFNREYVKSWQQFVVPARSVRARSVTKSTPSTAGSTPPPQR